MDNQVITDEFNLRGILEIFEVKRRRTVRRPSPGTSTLSPTTRTRALQRGDRTEDDEIRRTFQARVRGDRLA